MKIIPLSIEEANFAVLVWHRHHPVAASHKFSIAAVKDEKIVGVAICGRPVGINSDNDLSLEVLRVATDGTFNACSFLLGACAKVAKAKGYRTIQTYTLTTESGASLKAVGWEKIEVKFSTDHRRRHRVDSSIRESTAHSVQSKIKWVKTFKKNNTKYESIYETLRNEKIRGINKDFKLVLRAEFWRDNLEYVSKLNLLPKNCVKYPPKRITMNEWNKYMSFLNNQVKPLINKIKTISLSSSEINYKLISGYDSDQVKTLKEKLKEVWKKRPL